MKVNDLSFSSFVKKTKYCQREDYLMKGILKNLDRKGESDAIMGTDC